MIRPQGPSKTLAGALLLATLLVSSGCAPAQVLNPAVPQPGAPATTPTVVAATPGPVESAGPTPVVATGIQGHADAFGVPFTGAEIRLFRLGDTKLLESTTSDATGHFTLPIPAGITAGAPLLIVAIKNSQTLAGLTVMPAATAKWTVLDTGDVLLTAATTIAVAALGAPLTTAGQTAYATTGPQFTALVAAILHAFSTLTTEAQNAIAHTPTTSLQAAVLNALDQYGQGHLQSNDQTALGLTDSHLSAVVAASIAEITQGSGGSGGHASTGGGSNGGGGSGGGVVTPPVTTGPTILTGQASTGGNIATGSNSSTGNGSSILTGHFDGTSHVDSGTSSTTGSITSGGSQTNVPSGTSGDSSTLSGSTDGTTHIDSGTSGTTGSITSGGSQTNVPSGTGGDSGTLSGSTDGSTTHIDSGTPSGGTITSGTSGG